MACEETFPTPSSRSTELHETSAGANSCLLSSENHPSCSLNQCVSTRELLSEREIEINNLREESRKADRTMEILQKELASEGHRFTTPKDAAETPAEEILAAYLAEIEILRSQILNKEALVPFTTRDIRKHIPFDNKYFQNNMVDIKNEIDDFMCRCSEMSRPCDNIKLKDMSDDLMALLHRALGDSMGTLQAVSFHSLLRSILSAAVCDWVLEPDIRDAMIAECPLRDMMLSHLTTMGQLHLLCPDITVLIT